MIYLLRKSAEIVGAWTSERTAKELAAARPDLMSTITYTRDEVKRLDRAAELPLGVTISVPAARRCTWLSGHELER